MPDGTAIIVCLLIICFPPRNEAPAVVDSYARECRTYTISKRDTPETQKNIAQNNARCRAARGQKQ